MMQKTKLLDKIMVYDESVIHEINNSVINTITIDDTLVVRKYLILFMTMPDIKKTETTLKQYKQLLENVNKIKEEFQKFVIKYEKFSVEHMSDCVLRVYNHFNNCDNILKNAKAFIIGANLFLNEEFRYSELLYYIDDVKIYMKPFLIDFCNELFGFTQK